jgi:multiple sugar transport system ATP-binding protein
MGEIRLEHVTKEFEGGVVAVDHVDLVIDEGEFMVLVGPSGCGKTTLLRMISGLEDATYGSIWIGGRDVTGLPPRDRDIAMVFQTYALYPHMTVRGNLGYSLRVHRTPKEEIRRRVDEVARLIGLQDLLDRRPRALSGGQRQRVAMGRAIIRQPTAFLMDEPLSNLDAKLRISMRAELARLHERLGTTTVYVTHDQTEAMTLGQRVAVMRDGRIQQIAEPQTLYHAPVNLFVGAFIGSPSMNLVDATIEDDAAVFAGFRVPLDRGRRPTHTNGSVILGIRPESFEDAAFAERGQPTLDVKVTVLEEFGSDAHVIFPVDAPRVDVADLRAARDQEEDALLADSGALFNARVDPRTAARRGADLKLAVEPRQFYFFDPETGESLLDGARSAPGADSAGEASETVPAR